MPRFHSAAVVAVDKICNRNFLIGRGGPGKINSLPSRWALSGAIEEHGGSGPFRETRLCGCVRHTTLISFPFAFARRSMFQSQFQDQCMAL